MTNLNRTLMIAAITLRPALTASGAAVVSASTQLESVVVKTTDLRPFSHVAYIPVGSHLSSFKFAGIKVVRVFTKTKETYDTNYCQEAAFRDPAGSMFCPYTESQMPTSAYQVSYAFDAEPLPSDEYGDRYFVFSVYFRPGELLPALRDKLSGRKLDRKEAATFFHLTASRDSKPRRVLDEGKSTFCDGDYVEGLWTRTSPQCQDQIIYKTIDDAPDFVTVKVEPTLLQ